jgi:histone H3
MRVKHTAKKLPVSANADDIKKETVEDGDTVDPALRKVRKPPRFKPGTVALRDIRREQKSTDYSFPRASFRRLVKTMLNDLAPEGQSYRITEKALEAIQQDTEAWLTALYRESNRSARNANRIKITSGDFRLVHDLTSNGLEQLMCETHRFRFNGKTSR